MSTNKTRYRWGVLSQTAAF